MGECEKKTGTCEVAPAGEHSHEDPKCMCGGVCGGDPVVCAMYVWKQAFFEAKEAVMVDILKSKIQKAWGSKLDKMADAVLEAFEAKKDSMMAMHKAKSELMSKFEDMIKKG